MSDDMRTAAAEQSRWGDGIGDARRRYLEERLRHWEGQPPPLRDLGPFYHMKLTGADVYWLAARILAQGTGDASAVAFAGQRLRAAGEPTPAGWAVRNPPDLSELRLAGADLHGALLERAVLTGAHLEEANLTAACLEGADLHRAHLRAAILTGADLRAATLDRADLERATLLEAHLEGAVLREAHLGAAHLERAYLEQAYLPKAVLTAAHLKEAFLGGATLREANLEGADLTKAHLEGADLTKAHLKEADLTEAHLEGADLTEANLEATNLTGSHLGRKVYQVGRKPDQDDSDLRRIRRVSTDFPASLPAADLRGAFLYATTNLRGAVLSARGSRAADATGPRFADIRWGDANLTVMEWASVTQLWDEREARRALTDNGQRKSRHIRMEEYRAADRAYRLLAAALRAQGLAADAGRFHYRAELMSRYERFHDCLARLFSRRLSTAPAAFGRWLFSWLLGTFAGYGDRLGRLLLTYLVTVSAFAVLIFLLAGQQLSVDAIRDAYVLSITSFHGHGDAPPNLHPTEALSALTAIEAIFGLLIEGVFIAAFTRRVTGD